MLYSHCTQKCLFMYFLEEKNPCFVTKNCSKSFYICVFTYFVYLFISKNQHNWFYKNLHNSGMVGRRKLPDPSLNCIFNVLSIGVQYTLSFQWTNFLLKCLLCLMFSITWKPVNWFAFQAEVCKKHLDLQTYQQQYSIGSFYIGKICVGTAPVKM